MPESVNVSKITPGMGPTMSKLVEFLKPYAEGADRRGEVLTDEQLTTTCGKDTSVDGEGYDALLRAIRYVTRRYKIVWQRVNGANCIQCLDPDQTIGSSRRDKRRVRRISGYAVQKLKTVDPAEIPLENRSAYFGELAQQATLHQFSGRRVTKKLAEVAPTSFEEIRRQQQKMLEAFK